MGLKAGSLYVSLTLNASGFSKSLAQSLDGLSKVSKQVKRLSTDIGQMGVAMAASLGAVAAVASKFDFNVKKATDSVRGQFNALSLEIGRSLTPAIKAVADGMGNLVRALRAMDPQLRAQLTGWVTLAAKIGVAAFALSKIAGVVGSVFEISSQLVKVLGSVVGLFGKLSFAGLGKTLAAFAGSLAALVTTLAAVALGVVAIIVVVALARTAWAEWGDEIKKVGEQLTGMIGKLDKLVGFSEFLKDPFGEKRDAKKDRQTELSAEYRRSAGVVESLDNDLRSGAISQEQYDAQIGLARKNRDTADRRNTGFFMTGKDEYNPDSPASRINAGEDLTGTGGVVAAMNGKILDGINGVLKASGLGEMFESLTGKIASALNKLNLGGAVDGPEELLDVSELPGARGGAPSGAGSSARAPRPGSGIAAFGAVRDATQRFLVEFNDAMNAAGSRLMGAVVGSVSGLGDTISAITEGFSAGGPVGGLIAGLTSLVTQSQQFANVMGVLNDAFQALVSIVGVLAEPLMPLAETVRNLFVSLQPLADLYRTLAPILTVGLKLLTGLIWGLGVAIKTVINFFSGQGGDSFNNAITEMSYSMTSAANAAKGLAKGAADATEQILNAPEGFRVAAYRYGATNTAETPTTSTGGGGAAGPDTRGGAGNGGGNPGGGPVVGDEGYDGGGPVGRPRGGGTPRPRGGGPVGPGPKGGGGQAPKIDIHLHGSSVRDFTLAESKSNYRGAATRVNVIPKYAGV